MACPVTLLLPAANKMTTTTAPMERIIVVVSGKMLLWLWLLIQESCWLLLLSSQIKRLWQEERGAESGLESIELQIRCAEFGGGANKYVWHVTSQ